MNIQYLPQTNVSYLDALLLDNEGRLKVVPSAVYEGIPYEHLRLWCHLNAIYGLPTTELVDQIRALIGGRDAIEIGSGNGALGRALGIPMTDSFLQQDPQVRAYYEALGQPVIRYGSDVEKLDAMEAIAKYKPRVVVGSWITQISDGERPGSVYGVDEEALLNSVDTYILFGSGRNHGKENKVITQTRNHTRHTAPWMWSRTGREDSLLFVWGLRAGMRVQKVGDGPKTDLRDGTYGTVEGIRTDAFLVSWDSFKDEARSPGSVIEHPHWHYNKRVVPLRA